MYQILVVEDDRRVSDLLRMGLEECGYGVSVAYDGEMGLRLFSHKLCITDFIAI